MKGGKNRVPQGRFSLDQGEALGRRCFTNPSRFRDGTGSHARVATAEPQIPPLGPSPPVGMTNSWIMAPGSMQTKKMLITHSRSIGWREKVGNVMILKNCNKEGSDKNGHQQPTHYPLTLPARNGMKAGKEQRYSIKSERGEKLHPSFGRNPLTCIPL